MTSFCFRLHRHSFVLMRPGPCTALLSLIFALNASAATVRFVDVNSSNPTAPYLSWATAATNIQDAVDASGPTDQIVVTNGVYQSGGRTVYGTLTNRLVVDKPVTVASVNGPAVTMIAGYPVQGDTAVRCVYLTNNAALIGFTLLNGATRTSGDAVREQSGGGVWCESTNGTIISNCVFQANASANLGGGAYGGALLNCAFTGNRAGNYGGGAYGSCLTNCVLATNAAFNFGGRGGGTDSSVLDHCQLTANTALYGGGSHSDSLYFCTLTANQATGGGGADASTLNDCTLLTNFGTYTCGASYGGTLNRCTLTGNWADTGGGGAVGFYSTLSNCVLTANTTTASGGAAEIYCVLNNCMLSGNRAAANGGGVDSSCTLYNCTLTGNNAGAVGGGAADTCTLNNCIAFFNSAPSGPNYSGCTFNFSCTTPLPGSGANNITSDPQMADPLHISASSPCRAAGNITLAGGVDIDSEPWATPPSIGCDDYHAGSITGLLSVAIQADYTTLLTGTAGNFAALITGHATSNRWDFGDGTSVSNQLYVSRAWAVAGDYPMVLTVFNETHPAGISFTQMIHAVDNLICHVDAAATNPVPPYSSWATAAPTIQDAIDTALPTPRSWVLVTNGVYRIGARSVDRVVTNRVTVAKSVAVRSVNGPAVTIIDGGASLRCVYLTNGAALSGFTLSNGVASVGAGAWCVSTNSIISNCVFIADTATGDAGGVYQGACANCLFVNNSAQGAGGGAYGSLLAGCGFSANRANANGGGAINASLSNCTLTGNSSSGSGGGAASSTLNNCVVYYNFAHGDPNFTTNCTLNFCCALPLPASGTGNINAEPLLADPFHLGTGSPCIGAGSAAYSAGVDIDGEPWATPPSIGCDEFIYGSVVGPLAVSIHAAWTNLAAGFAADFTASISGRASLSFWDFADGTTLSNRPYASHAWASPGDFAVVFRAFNDSNPGGVSATALVHVVTQPFHYVSLTSPNPVAPYLSWASAATNIQDAADVAFAGGTVLVSNGVYQTGGRVVFGALTNRVAITRPITVQSVNGPGTTFIAGKQVPGATNGDSAVRCVYLTNNATLAGFTLLNGATRTAGDALREQSGGGLWCEWTNAIVSNCVLLGDSARQLGGAVYGGTVLSCTLSNNNAGSSGGGAYGSILAGCILSSNTAISPGGGGTGGAATSSTLTNCLLTGNFGQYSGGGAYGSTLIGCSLISNSTPNIGGGVFQSTVANSLLSGNSALFGGGADYSTLNNSTLVGNSAKSGGGGINQCTMNNCIIWFNTGPNGSNYSGGSTFTNCCTLPLPSGAGNIGAEPLLADLAHLSAGSPCRSAGSALYASGRDIDGEPWASPPSIGCDEFYAGGASGPLTPAIQASALRAEPGITVNFAAQIAGHASAAFWDFGDGTIVSNRPYADHSWSSVGDYPVTLRVFNDDHQAGVSATVIMHISAQIIYYADANGTNPIPPFESWATAATNLQDAVDAALPAPGSLILVTNGIYRTGGRTAFAYALTNRVAVTKPITLSSVNGPAVTVIQGYTVPGPESGPAATRCVYLTNNATLNGFTLINGATLTSANYAQDLSGAGVYCESNNVLVTNCIIIGNTAKNFGGGAYQGNFYHCTISSNSANFGGGAAFARLSDCALSFNSARPGGGSGGATYQSTLYNCILTRNTATNQGGASFQGVLNNCLVFSNSAYAAGGVYQGTLNNCTVVRNTAGPGSGGGVYGGTLNNCIVYYNGPVFTGTGSNYVAAAFNYSCTAPLPAGQGNFINAPLFVSDTSDFHLQPNSPCINSGNNRYLTNNLTDLDGNPRIVAATVDMGPYEFQGQGSGFSLISFAWLQQYGLPTDGSADFTDADGDGMNNWQEWIAGTNPTNSASLLKILSASNAPPGLSLTWQSVTGRIYYLQRATNLALPIPFSILQSNLPGQATATTFHDITATNSGPFFYRVGVQ